MADSRLSATNRAKMYVCIMKASLKFPTGTPRSRRAAPRCSRQARARSTKKGESSLRGTTAPRLKEPSTTCSLS